MNARLAHRVQRLVPSPTLAVSTRAKAMTDAGYPVISLAAGEPDLPTPTVAIEAAIKALRDGETRYTPVKGIPELLNEVAHESFLARGHRHDAATEVVVTVGAKQALFNIFQVLLDDDEEVLLPQPSWVSYAPQVELAGGVGVAVEGRAEEGFFPTIEALERAVTPKTRGLVLTSPSNPTGLIATPEQVEGVSRWAVERGVMIVSDEIYRRIRFSDAPALVSPLSIVGSEHVVVIDGVSKSHCMTGWRIGWALGPAAIIGAMAKVQSHQTSNPATVSQYAALAALKHADAHVDDLVRSLEKRRNLFVPRIDSITGVTALHPQGAFYVFVDVREVLDEHEDDVAFCQALLKHQSVAVVPGSAFGSPGWLRMSIAVPTEDLEVAADRLETFVNDRI